MLVAVCLYKKWWDVT